jgi:hypothetical protein
MAERWKMNQANKKEGKWDFRVNLASKNPTSL